MNIVVSIIIPTYRRPELLKRCVRALLAQKFDKGRFEIIVVSDGPDEHTQHIFDEWAAYDHPRLRFLSTPQKKGPAAARNYGWQNAEGKNIAFTDDDCIPDAHWLYEMVKNCYRHNNIALTGKVIVPLSKRPTDYEQNTAHLETADFITANFACTKEALIKAGGFDEQFSMAWREDSDLEFKLLQQQVPIKRIATAIVIHPVRQSVFGVSILEQKKTMFDALLYKKHPQLFKKKVRQVLSPVLYYLILISFLILIVGLIGHHNTLSFTGLALWIAFTGYFTVKRLHTTKLTLKHITEMVVTSLIIPFISVYWQWYGAVKYRVLFI